MKIEVRVLGPLEVSVDGISAVPTANKPSKVLAMLALNVGHVVTAPTLIEEIWDQHPPRTCLSTLQTYVLKVRKKLNDAVVEAGADPSSEIVLTRRNGYLLDANPDDVDVTQYTQLSKAGRRAANAGDHVNASRLLGSALTRWHGSALADVVMGPHLSIEAAQLEEGRLGDLELRIDADLHLDRHHELLGELAMLCARYPMLESFHAQYMLALYRSGRQWRALQAYREFRSTIADQLGIEPSPRLQRLHHAILRSESEVDDPNFVSSRWTPGRVLPAEHAPSGTDIAAARR
jgi:DNA-binding SARP family transcriptional activator